MIIPDKTVSDESEVIDISGSRTVKILFFVPGLMIISCIFVGGLNLLREHNSWGYFALVLSLGIVAKMLSWVLTTKKVTASNAGLELNLARKKAFYRWSEILEIELVLPSFLGARSPFVLICVADSNDPTTKKHIEICSGFYAEPMFRFLKDRKASAELSG